MNMGINIHISDGIASNVRLAAKFAGISEADMGWGYVLALEWVADYQIDSLPEGTSILDGFWGAGSGVAAATALTHFGLAERAGAGFRFLNPRPGRVADSNPRAVVYFIRRGDAGPIKIGFTRNVARRLAGLQTGSADPLTLLCAVGGSKADEAALHLRFADLRIAGEWFQPARALLDFISAQTPPKEGA